MKIFPEQVQDFYPTPGSLSTVMYFTGIDPRSGEKVYVCRNPHEKAMQRALIQYRNPQNHGLVKEALFLAGREDLIGFGANCLIKPRLIKNKPFNKTAKKPQSKVKAKKKTIRNVHKRKQTSR